MPPTVVCSCLLALYQWTQAEVQSSRSARPLVGPVRNGESGPDEFGFLRPLGRCRDRVVPGVPDGADRGRQPGQRQRLSEMHPSRLPASEWWIAVPSNGRPWRVSLAFWLNRDLSRSQASLLTRCCRNLSRLHHDRRRIGRCRDLGVPCPDLLIPVCERKPERDPCPATEEQQRKREVQPKPCPHLITSPLVISPAPVAAWAHQRHRVSLWPPNTRPFHSPARSWPAASQLQWRSDGQSRPQGRTGPVQHRLVVHPAPASQARRAPARRHRRRPWTGS